MSVELGVSTPSDRYKARLRWSLFSHFPPECNPWVALRGIAPSSSREYIWLINGYEACMSSVRCCVLSRLILITAEASLFANRSNRRCSEHLKYRYKNIYVNISKCNPITHHHQQLTYYKQGRLIPEIQGRFHVKKAIHLWSKYSKSKKPHIIGYC